MQSVQSGQSRTYLSCNVLNVGQSEVLSFGLTGLEKILLQELGEDHEVLSVVKTVIDSKERTGVGVTVVTNVAEYLDLVQGLVKVLFIVKNHLYAVTLFLP